MDIGKRGKSQLEQLKEIKTLQIPNPAGHRGAIDHNPPESKRKKQHIYISTLNTRSLKSSESLHELEQALQILKWDIVGLCEIRRSGEKIEDHGDYLLCYKNEIPGQYGVGFIVKAHLKPMIDEFIGVSDRIAVLNIALPGYKQPISLIQVYAPTEVSNIETKDSFYNELKVTLDCSHNTKIILGDFNSQIGKISNFKSKYIGPYTTGKRNQNGQRLIDFVHEQNLYIMNSFYNKKHTRSGLGFLQMAK